MLCCKTMRTLPFLVLALLTAFSVGCSHTTTLASAQSAANITSTSIPATASQTQQRKPASDETSYSVVKAETVTNVARRNLARTKYMTVPELEAAIRSENDLAAKQVWLKPGTTLTVPGTEPQPIIEHPRKDPADMEVRAIYLTGATAGSSLGLKMVEHWQEVGGNAVVFDIKDSDGLTSIAFEHPFAPHNHHAIENLPKYVRWLHRHNMHAMARIALFRDEHIARDFPRLAVQSHMALAAGANPAPWSENGKQAWTDTSNPEVQAYDIALAKYVAESGVDEVQFDYVRFPAEGNQKDAKFAFESAHPNWKRADVIADFLDRAYSELHPMGVLVSLDVFGVMAWQRDVDLAHTGQDIVRMAHHCDVLSPMIYPSHFFGMDGYALPGDAPEHFITTSMQRFDKITADSGVVIRPWLQAFGWKTKTYSPEYVMTQVKASKGNAGIGFLLWNARNDYSKPYLAMTQMALSPAEYFDTPATLEAKRTLRVQRVAGAQNVAMKSKVVDTSAPAGEESKPHSSPKFAKTARQ
jgi:hypothetical protein